MGNAELVARKGIRVLWLGSKGNKGKGKGKKKNYWRRLRLALANAIAGVVGWATRILLDGSNFFVFFFFRLENRINEMNKEGTGGCGNCSQ